MSGKPSTAPLGATRNSDHSPSSPLEQQMQSLDDSGVFETSFNGDVTPGASGGSPATSDKDGNESKSSTNNNKNSKMSGPLSNNPSIEFSTTSSLTQSSHQVKNKRKKKSSGGAKMDSVTSLTVDVNTVNSNIKKLRSTRPEGLSPHSLPLNGPPLYSSNGLPTANSLGSILSSDVLKGVVQSNKRAHDSTDPFSSPPKPSKKKHTKQEPHGNVFQRNSPNAKKALRSFLLNFTDEQSWKIKVRFLLDVAVASNQKYIPYQPTTTTNTGNTTINFIIITSQKFNFQ